MTPEKARSVLDQVVHTSLGHKLGVAPSPVLPGAEAIKLRNDSAPYLLLFTLLRQMSRPVRLVALFLCWAFGVIGGSVGLNALIKSNQEKSHLKNSAPPPTKVYIDTNDIFQVGVVVTVVCTLISIVSFNALLWELLPKFRGFAGRTRRIVGFVLAFLSVWLLASLIPFTLFFATGEAKVTAFIGPLELPQSAIQQVEKALGATRAYKDKSYGDHLSYPTNAHFFDRASPYSET